MEARTLKFLFWILLGLVLLANAISLIVYFITHLTVILIVTGIFDGLVAAPIVIAYGIYVLLVTEGQKIRYRALTKDLFKNIKISQ